jgi:hypothetical protein
MPSALPFQSDCCDPCDDPNVQNIPGAKGDPGQDGADGTAGVNAHTTLTADFTMPALGAVVSGVKVVQSAWMSVGQILYVENAGWMRVDAITDSSTVNLENLETAGGAYGENVAPTTTVPSGSTVSCGGLQGLSGEVTYAASGDIELDGSSLPRLGITTTEGDLIVCNSATAAKNTRLGVGATGAFLRANSGVAGVKMEWATIDLSNAANFTATLALPVTLGGTGGITKTTAFDNLSPCTTKGDIIVHNGSDNVRVAVGVTDGMLLMVDAAEAAGVKYSKLGPDNFGDTAEEVTVETIILRELQTSGTDGDNSSATPGSWGARNITEASSDTTGAVGASIAAHTAGGVAGNKFTLTQGFYRIRAEAVGYQIGYHQIRFWNVTLGVVQPHVGSANLIYGTTEKSPAASDIPTRSVLEGRFEVQAASEEFCIEHYAELASVVAGYGKAASIPSVSEVFLIIRIEKIAKS